MKVMEGKLNLALNANVRDLNAARRLVQRIGARKRGKVLVSTPADVCSS